MKRSLGITLTEKAADKIMDVINPARGESCLRVFVQGGGCSGFQYGFALIDQPDPEDLIETQHGVLMVVDPMSLSMIQGATLDYEEALLESRFVLKNPNAQSTCGCGNSFSID